MLTETKQTVLGVLLCGAAALLAMFCVRLPWNEGVNLSALTLAIMLGVLLGNTCYSKIAQYCHVGVQFVQQKLLRLAIILYGVRLSLHDIVALGVNVVVLDIVVTASVIGIGSMVGIKVLKMDKDTAVLTAAGSAICGAAAILAVDRVLTNTQPHKVSIAVATVVVFGTISMVIYPALYPFTGFSEWAFGVYTGATVHEVAQVIAAGKAVSDTAMDTAVITKMIRVLLLIPVLVILPRLSNRAIATSHRTPAPPIPWFIFIFAAVIVFNSAIPIPEAVKAQINYLDTLLLSCAMFALGLGTRWAALKHAGVKPLLLAALLMVWLWVSGYMLVWLCVG